MLPILLDGEEYWTPAEKGNGQTVHNPRYLSKKILKFSDQIMVEIFHSKGTIK